MNPFAPQPLPTLWEALSRGSHLGHAFEKLDSIQTLSDLERYYQAFEGCALKKTALQTVFGDGDPASPLVFIGEAPGAEEDIQGKPFVGSSGKMLEAWLKSIGLKRSQIYILNVVPWRPPENRTPTPEEIQSCLPLMQHHLRLLRPKCLITLGRTAFHALIPEGPLMTKAQGIWFYYKDCPLLPFYHPSYVLRSPGQKAAVWQSLRILKQWLISEGLFLIF